METQKNNNEPVIFQNYQNSLNTKLLMPLKNAPLRNTSNSSFNYLTKLDWQRQSAEKDPAEKACAKKGHARAPPSLIGCVQKSRLLKIRFYKGASPLFVSRSSCLHFSVIDERHQFLCTIRYLIIIFQCLFLSSLPSSRNADCFTHQRICQSLNALFSTQRFSRT